MTDPLDPLAAERAALARHEADIVAAGPAERLQREAGWGLPARHLRAVLAEVDRLRALLTPPTDATRLPHEWPTDTRDPLVCVYGCGAEPGDVLVEDECPRRLRRALAAAEGALAEAEASRRAFSNRVLSLACRRCRVQGGDLNDDGTRTMHATCARILRAVRTADDALAATKEATR